MMKPYDTDSGKKEQVRTMFDRIAPTYDRLNHILSLNVDRLWRRRVVRIVRRMKPHRIMDVATGTGDLAIAMARGIAGVHILGVDISEGMLAVARRKIERLGLDERIVLAEGDAEHLDAASDSIDVATVAFGVRNFGDMAQGLSDIARTLKRGGRIVVLEFSTPRNPLFGWFYRRYFTTVLPQIGGAVSKDRKAYDYLPRSVAEFPSPEAFMDMMRSAGFDSCRARRQSLGIAYIYTGVKR